MEESTFSFEKLKVYQVARALVKDIYVLQNSFPKEERYALGDQVRRAATSITANLAEASGRQSVKEKIHFIEIAFGSMDKNDLISRLREFIENEARSCSMDAGCITPEYIYRMWGGNVPLEEIVSGLEKITK